MARADHVAFLVHQRANDERTLDPDATALDRGGGDHRRREPALHVGGAASPDAAVTDVRGKRRMSPRGGITVRDDIGVAFDEQRPTGSGLADPTEDVRTPRRDQLDLDAQAFLREPALDVLGDGGFGGTGISGTDDARDADQVARERDQLGRVDVSENLAITRGGTKG